MRALVPGALALLALLLLTGCDGGHYAGNGMQPALVAPDVALASDHAGPVSFARTGGRLTVATIGYTSCPDVCPNTLSRWREVRHGLGADTSHVRFVFVSGDWRHDTPQLAGAFARTFDPSFVGVTGDSASLRRLLPAFQAEVGYGGPPGAAGASFAHSDFIYVLDDSGRIALWYPFATPAEAITRDLRHMMRARGLVRG